MKKGLSTLAVLGVGYLTTCAVLYAKQRDLLYRAPRSLLCADEPETLLAQALGSPSLRGWVDGPRESEHAVIYLGGSSESVELRRQDVGQVTSEATRYFMPYRGFGPNKDLITDESALKSDALRLFRQVAQKHDRVSVIARSLGTGIGVNLAANAPVHRLGLITPFDSIAKVAQNRFRWIPTGVMLRDRFESWRDADKVEAPVAACLAGLDKVVLLPRWHELRRHFKNEPREHLYQDADHTTIAQVPDMWQALGDFVLDRAPRPTRRISPR